MTLRLFLSISDKHWILLKRLLINLTSLLIITSGCILTFFLQELLLKSADSRYFQKKKYETKFPSYNCVQKIIPFMQRIGRLLHLLLTVYYKCLSILLELIRGLFIIGNTNSRKLHLWILKIHRRKRTCRDLYESIPDYFKLISLAKQDICVTYLQNNCPALLWY